MRKEEDAVASGIAKKRDLLQASEASFEELQKKVAASEARFSEFIKTGPTILSLSEAVTKLESRQRDNARALSVAAEQELSLQVKLNALHEGIKKETERLEKIRSEREHEEEDRRKSLEKAQRDFEEARHRLVEDFKKEETALSSRIKERIREMEEKHDILRKSLAGATDEDTVVIFANDLIKRIDLIDILIQRFSSPGVSGGVDQQLRTLRASFEDILAQHGIKEYRITLGTELSTELRQRIAVVENVSGPAKARVVENFRPGFIYSAAGGREVVLRKVEVKTSSE